MLSIALPYRLSRTFRRRRATASAVARIGADRRWNVVALTALAALVIGYLSLANANATAGYELRALERRGEALQQETRALEIRGLDLQTMEALTQRIASQGYVPVAHVRYLTPFAGAVAQR